MKHNYIKRVTRLFSFFLLTCLLSCDHHHSNEDISHKAFAGSTHAKEAGKTAGKVIEVKDGDTFLLLIDGKEQVVRLAHIDCPEKKQPFSNHAKQFAADLCFGKTVTLIHSNKYDRDRRLIAEVILPDGNNVNKELVKNGLAWHFKKYSKDTAYAQLEIAARASKAGLWSQPDPIAPWNRRKH